MEHIVLVHVSDGRDDLAEDVDDLLLLSPEHYGHDYDHDPVETDSDDLLLLHHQQQHYYHYVHLIVFLASDSAKFPPSAYSISIISTPSRSKL